MCQTGVRIALSLTLLTFAALNVVKVWLFFALSRFVARFSVNKSLAKAFKEIK
jgi:hypothetical protein